MSKSKKIIHQNSAGIKREHKRQIDFGNIFGGREGSQTTSTSDSTFGQPTKDVGASHTSSPFGQGGNRRITTVTRHRYVIGGPKTVTTITSGGRNDHPQDPFGFSSHHSGSKISGGRRITTHRWSSDDGHDGFPDGINGGFSGGFSAGEFGMDEMGGGSGGRTSHIITSGEHIGGYDGRGGKEKSGRAGFFDGFFDDEDSRSGGGDRISGREDFISDSQRGGEPFLQTQGPFTLVQMAQMLKESGDVIYGYIREPRKHSHDYVSTINGKPKVYQTKEQSDETPFMISFRRWNEHPASCHEGKCRLLLIGNVMDGIFIANCWREEPTEESADETYSRLLNLKDFVHASPR